MNLLSKLFRREMAENTEEVMQEARAPEMPAPKNLAIELRAAESAVNDAGRRKRNLDERLSEAIAAASIAEREWNASDRQFYSERKQFALRDARSRLDAVRKELLLAEKALGEAEAHLASVRRQISEDADYITAIAEQRKIVAEAREVASRAWSAPLFEVARAVSHFDGLMDREQAFVDNANVRLSKLGLPALRARIRNFRYALPLAVVDFDLNTLRSDASQALQRMVDF